MTQQTFKKSSIEKQITKDLKKILFDKFNVDEKKFQLSLRDSKEINLVKMIGIYLLHVTCQFTTTNSTKYFNRDRTMCGYYCRKVENMRDDYNFDDQLTIIENQISEKWEELKSNDSV